MIPAVTYRSLQVRYYPEIKFISLSTTKLLPLSTTKLLKYLFEEVCEKYRVTFRAY